MISKKKSTILLIFMLSYIAVTLLFKGNLWSYILSPILGLMMFYIVHQVFYCKATKALKLVGLFLSLSILTRTLTEAAEIVIRYVFHINPDDLYLIKMGHAYPNVLIVLVLIFYGFTEFHKWNRIQILLDSIVITFSILSLIWLIFLNKDIRNIIVLRRDGLMILSIACDVLICNLIAIWYLSIRNGRVPRYLKLVSGGAMLYAITDLIYYYIYLYLAYEPSLRLNTLYIIAFGFFAGAGISRGKKADDENLTEAYNNVGQNSKGILLLIAPLLILMFKGFQVDYLLVLLIVIMLYFLMAHYIQKNIYKEGLLQKEIELNNALEQKVKERTEELMEKNQVLENLLNQDFITGLKNRRYLLKYLDTMVRSINKDETIVLLYIDLNRYKMISTMYGYSVGEKILFQVAQKLKPLVRRRNSILTSYGDDAFIYAIKGKYDYSHGYNFAREVISLCSDIYKVENYQVKIATNIGISIYPKDADSKESLIRHADVAMSQARTMGYDTIQEFNPMLSEGFFRKNTIEIMLKKVDLGREFMLYYQPQLSTKTSEIVGFEALLRWRTPEGEMISPLEFIPIAEESGYIIPLGYWVIQTALEQLAQWNHNSKKKIIMGINISLKQLASKQFIEKLQEYIREYSLEPGWIDLEITESMQLQDDPEIIKILEKVRSLGMTISIDDFGTGYSSLSYLKNIPVDRIKIARELVSQIHMDNFDYRLVKSIISLSKTKGIRVIAEGVETREQWECLEKLGCDEVQGFFFGKPVPVGELEAFYTSEWERSNIYA